MHDGRNTHRDTLALVLVMGGMTTWAVFPALAFLRDHATGHQPVLMTALLVGCLLGGWVATSVLRAVAPATVFVAGALTAAVALGVVGYGSARATVDLGMFEVVAVLLATGAAGAGAQLRHVGEARPGLAAAAIVLAAMGASISFFAVVDPPADSALGSLRIAVMFATPALGAIAGALLCGDVRARSVSGWTFVLWLSVFAIVVVADDDYWLPVLIGGAVLSAGGALAAALGTWLAQKLRRRRAPPVVMPAAQVVER